MKVLLCVSAVQAVIAQPMTISSFFFTAVNYFLSVSQRFCVFGKPCCSSKSSVMGWVTEQTGQGGRHGCKFCY